MSEKHPSESKKKKEILIYALSTCVWCRKTRKLLDDLGVNYKVIEMDLIEDTNKKDEVKKNMSKWNPDLSYPTIVIDETDCITGFDEDKIRALTD